MNAILPFSETTDGECIVRTFSNGGKRWIRNGLAHRLDGPAVEDADGYKAWYLDGKRHRIDGPALIYPNGSKTWYRYGKIHRLDGPARIIDGGGQHWYVEGERVSCKSQEEFERLLKLKALW